MKKISVKTPAKINLTLEILNRRPDGFHNIASIMQAINLFDIATVEIAENDVQKIIITGNSNEIPYNEKNIAYKAAAVFFEFIKKQNFIVKINIEKNIPVCAGLAGGSTNAAGVFYALNTLFDNILNNNELNNLCAKLGSDLNFCLTGGTAICTSRGEIIEKISTIEMPVTLIKPKNLTISAKDAYCKFAALPEDLKQNLKKTEKLAKLIAQNKFDRNLIYNSLETAVINDYEELQTIKSEIKNSYMSGSGPTFFTLEKTLQKTLPPNFMVIDNLKFISSGIEIV